MSGGILRKKVILEIQKNGRQVLLVTVVVSVVVCVCGRGLCGKIQTKYSLPHRLMMGYLWIMLALLQSVFCCKGLSPDKD